jgi:hypothetical protein
MIAPDTQPTLAELAAEIATLRQEIVRLVMQCNEQAHQLRLLRAAPITVPNDDPVYGPRPQQPRDLFIGPGTAPGWPGQQNPPLPWTYTTGTGLGTLQGLVGQQAGATAVLGA